MHPHTAVATNARGTAPRRVPLSLLLAFAAGQCLLPIAVPAAETAAASAAGVSTSSAAPAESAAVTAVRTGIVTGRVYDRAAEVSLEKARVSLVGSNRETLTDAFGEFRLTGVPAGRHSLLVFYTGLRPQTVDVVVGPGELAHLEVALEASSQAPSGAKGADSVITLDAFVVADAKENSAAAIAINEQRFANNIKTVVATDAFGDVVQNNVGEFVKFLPGVDVSTDQMNAVGISLRGMPADMTSISIDGEAVTSAGTSGASRGTPLQAISLNNATRVEIMKVPTPDMPATSLGGSVNLVSRNAFELRKTQTNFRIFTNMNNHEAKLAPQRGGSGSGDDQAKVWRWRPDFDFSHTTPITRTIGLSFNAVKNDQYNVARRIGRSFNTTTTAANPKKSGVENPYLASFSLNAFPVFEHRYATGLRLDWKLSNTDLLTVSYSGNYLQQDYEQHTATFNTGTNPLDWGSDFTHGRPGSGSATLNLVTRYARVRNNVVRVGYNHIGELWDIQASAGYNTSHQWYRHSAKRQFELAGVRVTGATVDMDGFSENTPGKVTLRDASGRVLDPFSIRDYSFYINGANQTRDMDGDAVNAQISVKRKFFSPFINGSVKTGFSTREEFRMTRYNESFSPIYVGADGRAGTADDAVSQAPIDLLNYGFLKTSMPRGNPLIQFPSARRAWELWEQYPQYFDTTTNRRNDFRNPTNNALDIMERVDAAYVMLDGSVFNNRLRFVTGVRYERTTDDGRCVGIDSQAKYQHDAQGNLILDANKKPILVTTDPVAQDLLMFTRLGTRMRKEYGDWYPSLNVSYNITPNFITRLGYARTLGRPSFGNIIGSTNVVQVDFDPNSSQIGSALGTITTKNPALKPWTANAYDVRFEYYTPTGGTISAGVFRKEIDGYAATQNFLATSEFLQTIGLGDEYLDYQVSAPFNIPGKTYTTGYEAEVSQSFARYRSFIRHFRVFANTTIVRTSGVNSSYYTGFTPYNVNWGLTFVRRPLSVMLKWTLIAPRRTGTVSATNYGATGWNRQGERIRLDLSTDYQLNRNFGLFFSARNIFNNPDRNYAWTEGTPHYARFTAEGEYGVLFQLGVKGSF